MSRKLLWLAIAVFILAIGFAVGNALMEKDRQILKEGR